MEDKDQKFSRRVRMYKEDYLSVCVFLNVLTDGSKFYDTVIYRKVKTTGAEGYEYKRGTNLKPKDLSVLVKLLGEANEFIRVSLEESAA